MCVTDGLESAFRKARPAGDRDVQVSGEMETVRRFIRAGLLERFHPHIALVQIRSGARSFDGIDPSALRFRPTRALESERTTHLRYELSHRHQIGRS